MRLIKRNYFTIFLFGCLALLFCFPVLKNLSNWGQNDWDQFTYWNAVPRETLLQYHQFPLWTPYTNGGNVVLAHPHSPFLSPFYVFVLLFGPVIGLKCEIILHVFVGLLGMFLLARSLNFRQASCYLAAVVFMFNSIYPLHLTEGHAEWMAMAFVPWVLLYFQKGLERLSYAFAAMIFLSLMLLGGSVDVFTVFVAFLTVYALLVACQKKKLVPIKLLLAILTGTFLLCAIKLFPLIEFLYHNPRLTHESSGIGFDVFLNMLFSRNQAFTTEQSWAYTRQSGLPYQWHEYGAYIGILPFALCLLGAATRIRSTWPLLIAGLFSMGMAFGSHAPVKLWEIVHQWPVYNSLHVPSRFILGLIFSSALMAGYGLTFLEESVFSGKQGKKVISKNNFVWGIVLFVLIDLYCVNVPIYKNAFTITPVYPQKNSEFAQRYRSINLHASAGTASSMYPVYLSNSGIVDGYEVIEISKENVRAVGDRLYRGEAYWQESSAPVSIQYFSPNKLIVKTLSEGRDRLIINQNYYTGWKARIDGRRGRVESFNGLISVPLPPGQHTVTFYYLPLSFLAGVAVSSSFGLIVCYWLLKRKRL